VRILKKFILMLQSVLPKRSIMYLNGPQMLPPPLASAQEEKAFKLLEQGDEAAKNLIISHNLRLVVYIAKKFEATGINIEDLTSIGTIGLIKAVSSFRPSKQIKLATYASRCIENEILMFLRKASNKHHELSFDEPLNTDREGNELLLSDILGDDDSISQHIESQAESSMLHGAVEQLNDRERYIIELRYGLDGKKEHTQKEVAELIGISQSYISRLEKRIISNLKATIEHTL